MGERPAEIETATTGPDERTGRAAVQTDAELEATPADDPQQIRLQIEQTRDEMSETIDAIQERLSPRNLVEQAKDSVREATVGKVKQMAHNVSDTASDMADSTKEAASDLAERVRDNPWPTVLLGLGAAWLYMRNGYGNGASARYSSGADRRLGRAPRPNEGGMMQVIRENPVPAALAGLGVGMLAMRVREGSTRSYQTDRRGDWRRPSDATTGYETSRRSSGSYVAESVDQLSDSYDRAKQTVTGAAERAQEAASESVEAAQQKVSAFSSQARSYSEDMLNRNPLLVGPRHCSPALRWGCPSRRPRRRTSTWRDA